MRSPTTSMRAPANPPRTLACTRSDRSNLALPSHHCGLDEVTQLVTEEEVRFLDAWSVLARDAERNVGGTADRAALGARDRHRERSPRVRELETLHDVGAPS